MKNKNIEAILKSYKEIGVINHLEGDNLPSRKSIHQILDTLREIIFPGFFETTKLESSNLAAITEKKVDEVINLLKIKIFKSVCWECKQNKEDCSKSTACQEKANKITDEFISYIPALRKELKDDATANFKGDPAAKSVSEIILTYPGFQAITVYRVANFFYKKQVPLIPRIMTEISHSETGVDIHPGANIGKNFCIDHGTGIVIGETSVIGNNVKLYQGVTIGAVSVKNKTVNAKRHPTINDNVVIYARTTILGGNTIIGKNCIIGGNVWLTKSVPDNSKIYGAPDTKQIIRNNNNV
jgi:serine O-acetyltransferase